jgi:hypothetical protein
VICCLLHYWELKEGKKYDPRNRIFEGFPADRQPKQKSRVAGTPVYDSGRSRGKARRPQKRP